MQLVITLRKDVADRDEGKQIFELVKMKLVDRPEIKVAGHITNHFVSEDPKPQP
ncbi:unnamed protein product [marine sediment metagenome]|uniref:Uncharacterized protein n=1 Tax=marine sediment metagenome TaxID=412755 RepID=X1JDK9_9ZZZZ